jgi:D-xylose transport system substrate-binding protein
VKHRRIIFLKFKIILVVFVIVIGACRKEQQVKIGYLFPNMVSGRYQKEKIYFSEKIKELGGEALITSADYNDQTQIRQAKELIDQGAKVLVVNPLNLNTAAAIIRFAHESNVPVIAYDRLIRNCDLDYFITFDNEKVGKLMADYVIKSRPQGKYILLGGDKADQNAVWVKKGQQDALKSYLNSGGIKIVYDIYVEDWSGDNARNEIKRYLDLSGDIPDVILSSYDGMSTGVIDLLREYGIQPGQILITGQDAELPACRNMVQDYQTMTIYKSVRNLAFKAAEISIKLTKNEKVTEVNTTIFNGEKEVPTIFLDPVLVDKNNLKTTIVADGFHTESEIYQ